MKMGQKASKWLLIGFAPFGLRTHVGPRGAWYEHARGPWGLPLFCTHFQQAESPCGALRGFSQWIVEGVD